MGFFDDEENVESYIKMVEGEDGAALVEVLARHLDHGATVLELGMGPGTDLEPLAKHFDVTGSDSSSLFVARYLSSHPESDVMLLDAVTMDTGRRFDAIYSNKVLQHLPKPDAARSIAAQHRVLNTNGIVMHSLWHGDSAEEHHGLLFQQYTLETFGELITDYFDVVESERYGDIVADDSLYVVLRAL
jgi:cyclopropane fatty-acyl-phospholipid synthase-like methyltransferase